MNFYPSQVQNGVVINFEKIGPDPPPVTEKSDDLQTKEEPLNKEPDFNVEQPIVNDRVQVQSANQPLNTSWYTCRKMIYVPRPSQKGYPLGNV